MDIRGTHVADALKHLRRGGAVLPGWSGEGTRFCGTALPVECVWEPFRDLAPQEYSTEDVAAAVAPGSVPVFAAHGDPRAVFGPVAALVFARAGAAGVVVDGAVRGTAEINELGLPTLARHRAVLSGYGQVRRRVADRVIVGGVEICAGDLLVCDDGNLAVVPAGIRDDVLAWASSLRAGDDRLMRELADGAPFGAAWSVSERNHVINRDKEH